MTQHFCARASCNHRLRMHHQDGSGNGKCLRADCDCVRFLEVDPHALLKAMMDADPVYQMLKREVGEPEPQPHCRHREGEEDCSPYCLLMFGDAFYTEVIPLPVIGQHPAEWDTVPGSVRRISRGGPSVHDRTPEPTEEALMNIWQNRHPSVKHFAPFFDYAHLPPHLQEVSRPFGELASVLLARLKDGPELSSALRKLVEAKDCAVRQAVLDNA